MSVSALPRLRERQGFHHEAVFYSGRSGLLDATMPFVEDALRAGEPTMVALEAPKIEWLRSTLGRDADAVRFVEMVELGRNPARIIPAWTAFVSTRGGPGRRVRGIGEPVWPGRGAEELDECHRHEALLNWAFANARAFWLRCPYDVDALDRSVIAEAQRTHPYVVRDDAVLPSAGYPDHGFPPARLDANLPDPPEDVPALEFGSGRLHTVRQLVAQECAAAGLDRARSADLVLAVNEVATNSLRHGGGGGLLRAWHDRDAVVCEIRDEGLVHEPLVGREHPPTTGTGGRGLWLVNQLCDLVQLRSSPSGTVVRMTMRRH